MRMWTDEEEIEVNNTLDDLIKAMAFKATHIKAKADPEIFVCVERKLRAMRYKNEVVKCDGSSS